MKKSRRFNKLDSLNVNYFVIATLLICGVLAFFNWLIAPAIRLSSGTMWINVAAFIFIIIIFLKEIIFSYDWEDFFDYVPCSGLVIIIPLLMFCVFFVWGIFGGEFFTANSRYEYVSSMVTEIKGENAEEAFPDLIPNGDTSNLPLYGEKEAYKKVETLMGSQGAIGSQFEIGEDFTSQSINGNLYYVSALEPSSMFKWNKKEGSPGYYIIDRNTGNVEFKDISLKYTVDAPFNSKAYRKIRSFEKNLGITDLSPEVADDGTFYYVATTYKQNYPNAIKKVTGVITLNAATGEMKKYSIEDAPKWIDRIYPEEFFDEYIHVYGKYSGGRSNAIFAKKGLEQATDGKDVVYIEGVCYYYTGWTSVGKDGSSTGIMMMNSRTGEMKLYNTYGINESKAKSIANGKVQAQGYKASYPLLLNVSGQQTFFMLMRDKSDNLVGYAFVNYKDYTKVAVESALQDAQAQYIKVCSTSNNAEELKDSDLANINDVISSISSEVVEGTTMYYVKTEKSSKIFTFASKLDVNIVFAKPGDKISIDYIDNENQLINAIKVTVTISE